MTFERVIFKDVLFSNGNRLLDFATVDISFTDCYFIRIGQPISYISNLNASKLQEGDMKSAMIRNYLVIARLPFTPPQSLATTFIVTSCIFNNISSLSAPIFEFERFVN